MSVGDGVRIEPGCGHTLVATTETLALEHSPNPFDPDDIFYVETFEV